MSTRRHLTTVLVNASIVAALCSCSSDGSSRSPSGSSEPDAASSGSGGHAGAGGASTAGANAGGANAGGANAGGTNAGGTNAGGTNAGGANAGGTNAGGTNAGGANAGGASSDDGGLVDASAGGADASAGGGGNAGAGGSASPDAAAPDGAAEAGPVTCSASCPYGVCDGAACAVTRVVEGAGSAWGVAVVGGSTYWTTGSSILACSSPPCTGGAALATAQSGHTYFGIAAAAVASEDFLFVTDNNYQQGLLRLGVSGSPKDPWASASGNAAAVATAGAFVAWGDQSKVYRSATGAAGATQVMDVGPAFFTGTGMPGPPIQNVAVDASAVFAASAADVYRCAIDATCVGSLVPVADQPMTNVLALAIAEGTLYALGGTPFVAGGVERIWSVPASGGTRSDVAQHSPASSGGGMPIGLVADSTHLYWGSLDGDLYTCSRTGTCTPTILVPGARASGLAQDATHVYWADRAAGSIYRVVKP